MQYQQEISNNSAVKCKPKAKNLQYPHTGDTAVY